MDLDSLKKAYVEDGYCIFNIDDDDLIDQVVAEIRELLISGDYKTNSRIYSYNDSPRVVESYKHSASAKNLALHRSVISVLKALYDGESPKAFSTINFMKSTQQPLHSDYFHFGTVPALKLVGTWVALEDINPNSGPLRLVPGRHLDCIYVPDRKNVLSSLSGVKEDYKKYEKYVSDDVLKSRRTVICPQMTKGDCIVWAANMLHGSPECIDPSLSRMAQVTHWAIGDKTKIYNPLFSDVAAQKFAYRDVEFIN